MTTEHAPIDEVVVDREGFNKAAIKGEHTDDLLVDEGGETNNVFRVIDQQSELVTIYVVGSLPPDLLLHSLDPERLGQSIGDTVIPVAHYHLPSSASRCCCSSSFCSTRP